MIKPIQYGLCLSRLVGGSWYENADLRGADLRGVNLRGADLRYADLRWADLREASKHGRKASPVVCALAKVGAPWYYVDWEWGGYLFTNPEGYDHWAGLAKLYMLGGEGD